MVEKSAAFLSAGEITQAAAKAVSESEAVEMPEVSEDD